MRQSIIIVLVSLFLSISLGCAQEPSTSLVGSWRLERDPTLSITFSNDSVYIYLFDSLILQEHYQVSKSTLLDSTLYYLSEGDTTEQVIMGLTDNTLTLMDRMQGKLMIYKKID